jgi:hypothetical protein
MQETSNILEASKVLDRCTLDMYIYFFLYVGTPCAGSIYVYRCF